MPGGGYYLVKARRNHDWRAGEGDSDTKVDNKAQHKGYSAMVRYSTAASYRLPALRLPRVGAGALASLALRQAQGEL